MDSGSIAITTWEVGFASPHTPTRVESLPIPDGFDLWKKYQLHPTSSRLAFVKWSLSVWDAQHSKFLLSTRVDWSGSMSFSSDGRFFACGTGSGEIHLWKESPTGYTLHRKFTSNAEAFREVLVSPNGESIIALDGPAILLWRTADSIASPSDVSTPTAKRNQDPFVLGLSPDGALVAFARNDRSAVTVLDVKSGIPRLRIDAGMAVSAVGVAGRVVVVVCVGWGKIFTWNLPAGNDVLNPRATLKDSVLTTVLGCPPTPFGKKRPISVSPDLRRIAMAVPYENDRNHQEFFHLYDVATGNLLASELVSRQFDIIFTPDGREVWSVAHTNHLSGWKIIEDSESNFIRLEHRQPESADWSPWRSSRDYQVTDEGWVLNPSGKQHLWLPPSWRLVPRNRRWSGRFLMLLDSKLPEPVILELEE
ncbi:YVTN repeat-like/Quino protein amine dehydrogenase [Thelephora ganbajun]|uniref:YVTN repeat-like/Quino protein amine dehydrogenase n=1 Tax=Thelephora ganbajun TaxID=370292 RepID=A0ACB6Z204_THEGA|nr:YVTN repeat-like/Quino protein amine dehydrogenase [Thelephora ganbajun]